MLEKKILLLALFISAAFSFRPVDISGCGVTKGCLRPTNCPNGKICDYLATWKSISGGYVEFELVGKVKSRSGFIHLRFSEDKIEGNDGLLGCYVDESTGKIAVKAGYIDALGESRYYEDDNPEFIVTEGDNLGGVYSEGDYLQCRFRRLMAPKDDIVKNLSPENEYHIGLYRGSEREITGFGKPFLGGVAFSNEKKSVSSPLYGSYSGKNHQGINLAKAHGMLMVLAWVFCASVGTLISRYYKLMMPNKSVLNEPLWFQAHRIIMGFSVGLTILSVILIIIYCNGYSKVDSWPHYVHPILGFIVLALALINPFVAFFRCAPNDQKRAWHNWIHFFIGIICFCLSFIQMFLGLRMTGAGQLLSTKDEPISLLIFFVIFQFCCEIVLEIHGCIYARRNEDKIRMYEEAMAQQMNQQRLGGMGAGTYIRKPEPAGRVFKYFMLGLHITVASIVTVVLMIMIAVN